MATSQTTETKQVNAEIELRDPSPFDKITHHKQRLFLIALSENPNCVLASKLAGLSRTHVYHWRRTDPVFAEAYEVAAKLGAEVLEGECFDRAMRSNFPSDTLAMFLLKGIMPAKYGDKNRLELSGVNGQPIKLDYSRLSDEQLAQLEQLCALATVRPAEIEPPTVDVSSQVVLEPAKNLAEDRATIQTPTETD